MTVAQYSWFMDWGDDSYSNPYVAIPAEHVWDYAVTWGTTLDAGATELGLITSNTGRLTLFDEGGQYVIPGALTRDQLQYPHRWSLYIGSILVRQGRAIPTLGPNLGSDVQPATWILEGPWGSQLAELIEFTAPAGTMWQVLQALTTASDITLSLSPTLLDRRIGAIEWRGSLAGLINAIADMGPAWAIETANGHIILLDVAHGSSLSGVLRVDERYNVGLLNSGLGLQHGLVRTRMTIPGVGEAEDELVVFGDEERWGRRTLSLPPWLENTATGRNSAFNAALNRSEPQTFVRLDLQDDQPTATMLGALAAFAVPSATLEAVVPSPAGSLVSRFTVLRATLSGGQGRRPERLLEGLAPGQPGLVAQVTLGKPIVTVAPNQLSATAILPSTPDGTDRWWRYRRWNGASWDPYSAATQYVATTANERVTMAPLEVSTFYEIEFTFDANFATDRSISTVFETKPVPGLLQAQEVYVAGQWALARVEDSSAAGLRIASTARWVPRPSPNNATFAVCTAIADQFGFVIDTTTNPWSLNLRLHDPLPNFVPESYLLDVRPDEPNDRRISGYIRIQAGTFDQYVDIDTSSWRRIPTPAEYESGSSNFSTVDLTFDQMTEFYRVAREGGTMTVTSTLRFEP